MNHKIAEFNNNLNTTLNLASKQIQSCNVGVITTQFHVGGSLLKHLCKDLTPGDRGSKTSTAYLVLYLLRVCSFCILAFLQIQDYRFTSDEATWGNSTLNLEMKCQPDLCKVAAFSPNLHPGTQGTRDTASIHCEQEPASWGLNLLTVLTEHAQ